MIQTNTFFPLICLKQYIIDRGEHLKPFKLYFEDKLSIIRVPFLWEDDIEMNKSLPLWDLSSILEIEGIKIFNFHSVHICLNIPNMKTYIKIKNQIYSNKKLKPNSGLGPLTAFSFLLNIKNNLSHIKEIQEILK